MKPTNNKTQFTLLQDALLDLSEADSKESVALLQTAGANPDALVNRSMSKIEQHRLRFAQRLESERQTDLLASVQDKIKHLLKSSPERTSSFLNSYFSQRSLKVQFAANAGFDRKKLYKVQDKIDLDDLSKQLDAQGLNSESAD